MAIPDEDLAQSHALHRHLDAGEAASFTARVAPAIRPLVLLPLPRDRGDREAAQGRVLLRAEEAKGFGDEARRRRRALLQAHHVGAARRDRVDRAAEGAAAVDPGVEGHRAQAHAPPGHGNDLLGGRRPGDGAGAPLHSATVLHQHDHAVETTIVALGRPETEVELLGVRPQAALERGGPTELPGLDEVADCRRLGFNACGRTNLVLGAGGDPTAECRCRIELPAVGQHQGHWHGRIKRTNHQLASVYVPQRPDAPSIVLIGG
mmetsp:Transcript_35340/g.79183  ORF Transcript_35340/g.79183 Transcript_35340/m.79183 type:complete len:263 (+) Transcript_35340:666-1454(+)